MVCAAMSGVILWSEVSLVGQLLVNGTIKHAQPLRALLNRSQGDIYAGRVGGRRAGVDRVLRVPRLRVALTSPMLVKPNC